jgi:hypothetical protein
MNITPDFIRGLIVGEGCFTFSARIDKLHNRKIKIPTFSLKMHIHDRRLLTMVRDALGLDARVYEYNHNKWHYALLIIRNIGDIKDIIIPFFYNKLIGYKKEQFNRWLNRFNEPDVAESYKFIYRLYKSGFYDRDQNIRKF